MPERSSYVNGTPSWVDLSTPDVAASIAFYRSAFGWDAHEPGPVEETGGYTMFTQGGKNVAGVGPIQAEGQPAVWTTYIAVDDADRTHQLALDAGGQSFVPPFDVLEAGRMALIADTEGAIFGVWQAAAHHGADLVNEPVSLCWNELASHDLAAATRFYGAVFGWTGETADLGGSSYTTFMLTGTAVAGLFEATADLGSVPAHWGVVFSVADPDAVCEQVAAGGGKVVVPPNDIPVGRVAYVTDQFGAPFQVIRLSEPGA